MPRRLIAMVALVALALLVGVGLRQARDRAPTPPADRSPLRQADVSRPVPGTPRELARLRARGNELQAGGTAAFDAHLRALRGRPIVVNVWASWCPPCRAELPLFQRAAVKHAATVAFLGVDVADDRGRARELLALYPLPYPSVVDPRFAIPGGRFGSRTLPITVFYAPDGTHVMHQGPFSTQRELDSEIARYASAMAPARAAARGRRPG